VRYTDTELAKKADEIRETVIKMLVNVGSGHTGGALGSADFWTALYLGDLVNVDPKDPWNEDRDRVVLSAGHYCTVQYAVLAEAGFFAKEELYTLREIGSRLQGHPVVRCVPGIENTSGPLGRMDHKKWRVVCFMGDGEQQEGQVWEAYMLAAKEKLDNLTIVIDRNQMQIDGHTEEVMPLEPLRGKLEAFGLKVIEVNGNRIAEIVKAMNEVRVNFEGTSVVMLHTIPGEGVGFMEGDVSWHGKAPNIGEAVEALRDLEEDDD
jgi:transketolase